MVILVPEFRIRLVGLTQPHDCNDSNENKVT